jgi:hypothetical protein
LNSHQTRRIDDGVAFSELTMTNDNKEPQRRQYPPLYEKAVPVALVIIAIIIAVLVLVIVGVILGVFPWAS